MSSTTEPIHRRADRPQRRQRPRGHPGGRQHRRRRGRSTRSRDNADAIFTWDYEKGARPALNKLYEKAKTLAVERRDRPGLGRPTSTRRPSSSTPTAPSPTGRSMELRPDRHAVREVGRRRSGSSSGVEQQNWTLSQFMHGEQGALLCTAKIVETVPWIDAKYYAADPGDGRGPPRRGVRQVPRHQAVGPLPDQRPPAACCSTTSSHDSRWDMTYLGMQIMVEGLALAAFGFMHMMTHRAAAQAAAALRDERRGPPRGLRRALAEGVLRRADRRRDARAPGVRLRGRGAHARPVPAAGGVGAHGRRPVKDAIELRACGDPSRRSFQQMLFSKIVPNCKKLGLLDARADRLAARAVQRARRHPVRGLGRHRRGVRVVPARPRARRAERA